MRRSALALLTTFLFATPTPVPAQGPAPAPPPASCNPAGGVRFVCGQSGPEDLVAVPGTAWLLASGYGPAGGLQLIDTKAASSRRVFPEPQVADRLDRKSYDSCPGPIPAADRQRFWTHGLYLKAARNRVHTLYVVHHGSREAIEVFELDARRDAPSLTWVGCAVAPGNVGLNSVIALPEGGFAATNFEPRGAAGGGLGSKLLSGENNGEVWEWHTKTGWQKVPGSDAAGANGIELSADGKWYYISQWGNRSFMRLSRGATPVKRDQISLGFRVDNVRWAPDGTLLVAGQGGSDDAIFGRGQRDKADVPTSVIGKVDPKTMTYKQLISVPTSDVMSPATVAIQVGNEYWTGAFRGDRLVIYPVGATAAGR
jgi:hypothetical protein